MFNIEVIQPTITRSFANPRDQRFGLDDMLGLQHAVTHGTCFDQNTLSELNIDLLLFR